MPALTRDKQDSTKAGPEATAREERPADGLLQGKITDEAIDQMRKRIGYPNPTLRYGMVTWPWNETATTDAIRHFVQGYGDNNPLFTSRDYAAETRWRSTIAPPGFEWTMGLDRSPQPPSELHERTRKALRGVQLFNAGHEGWHVRPIVPGDVLYRSSVIASVEEKKSEFAGRSVVVTNENRWFEESGATVAIRRPWYIHAERRAVSSSHKYADEELAVYTDEQIDEIEAAYDAEFVRGSETLYYEDVVVDEELPRMVKGPLVVTDMINFFMGAGWYGYGFPALRLGYENRKSLRGFYTRDERNAWDSLMRIHWEPALAERIGVKSGYDIGPIRYTWLLHYCTNFAGDDAWPYHVRGEFRRFNYVGDTTWISGRIAKKFIDPELGPCIELSLSGRNQRGDENIRGLAHILVPSHKIGPVKIPVRAEP
jgi:acyl dehydratase